MPNRTKSSSHAITRSLAAVGVGAAAIYGARVLLDFFAGNLPYTIRHPPTGSLEGHEFLQFLSLITDSTLRRSRVTRLRDGAEFYPAELAAIGRAQHSINIEFYEFLHGRVAQQFVDALCERARAGVEVRLIVDAIGSFGTPDSFFQPLRAAGGQMRWYHPIRWNTWQQANNRSHRKQIIVDGETGIIGGAGIADHWLHGTPKAPAWRDTMLCVEGEAVAGMISTFSENWLESSGEVLSGAAQFGFRALPEGVPSFVIPSTPHGGGTQARILFQVLLESARKSICITTPYFLPDKSGREALVRAVKRGVSVEILTAGPKIDHPIIRRLSRRSSQHLLAAGARIWEYQPAMIHAKLMTVDGLWSVAGSTNFDHRSFALNDEVNLAVLDSDLVASLDEDFRRDLAQSKPLTKEQLQQRTTLNIVGEIAGRALYEES